jgi:hypothetical protein
VAVSEEEKKKMMDISMRAGAGVLSSLPKIFYEETSNPLFLFKAYKTYRDLGQPPPEWVFEYFDRVVLRFLKEVERRRVTGTEKPTGRFAKKTPEWIISDFLEMRVKDNDIFNEGVRSMNKRITALKIAHRLTKENPELLNNRAGLIRLIAAEMNESYPDVKFKDSTLDKWFSRPISEDIEKWDRPTFTI